MRSFLLSLSCLWLLAALSACSGDDSPVQEESCPKEQSLWYDQAGCSPEIKPRCSTPPPPCADAFCGCSGQTITGCGVTREPYRFKGACEG